MTQRRVDLALCSEQELYSLHNVYKRLAESVYETGEPSPRRLIYLEEVDDIEQELAIRKEAGEEVPF